MIRIFTDLAANLPQHTVEEHDIQLLHLTYTVDGVENDPSVPFDAIPFHVVFPELRRDSRVTTGNSGCLLCWPRQVQSSIRVAKESPSIHDQRKTIALTRRTFVGKVMSLLFNMLSRSQALVNYPLGALIGSALNLYRNSRKSVAFLFLIF